MSSLINSLFSSGTGIDVNATVDQILYAERAPERLMQSQQSLLSVQTSVLNSINANLTTLLDKVNALKDASGAINAKSASSSQTGILTATADTTAIPAVHTMVVRNLATTSTFYSDALASTDTTFSSGSFTLQVGAGDPTVITIDDSNNTLNTLAASINDQKLGVTASVIADSNGSRLLLTSNSSGAPGQIAITNNTTGLVLNQGVTGLNAALTVDGVDMSHPSNLVNTAIPGVVLNLISAAPETPVTVTVSSNTTVVRQAVTDFVSAYNAVASAINLEFKYDETTKSAGPLAGDASLRSLQASLLEDVSYSIDGNNGFVNLQSLGIEMENDGTLTFNDSKLDDVLNHHLADFQNFFQGLSPAGFAHNFSADLGTLTSTTEGPLYVELSGIKSTQDMLTQSIEDFENRMAVRKQQLTNEYSQIDAVLRTFPTLLQEIQAELATLDQHQNS